MQIDCLELNQIIGPVVEAMGYELWGYDFNSGRHTAHLRVYIDSREGVSVDDCARVSHQLSGVFDVEDPIRGPYTLEISSPGLDRPLLKPSHFRRYTGKRVKVRLRWQVEGRRNITGELQGIADGKIMVKQEASHYAIPLEAIDRARLVPEFC